MPIVSECAVALNVLFSGLIVRADRHQEEGNNTERDHINEASERGREEEEMRRRCVVRPTTGRRDKEDAEWKGVGRDLLLHG